MLTTEQIATTYDSETATTVARSGYGLIPGGEFPMAIYVSVAGAFAWMLTAAWIAFGTATGTDLDLAMVTVLGTVFLAIPAAMHYTAATRYSSAPTRMAEFLSSQVDTATGPIPAVRGAQRASIPPARSLRSDACRSPAARSP